jgi:hypothetical protein
LLQKRPQSIVIKQNNGTGSAPSGQQVNNWWQSITAERFQGDHRLPRSLYWPIKSSITTTHHMFDLPPTHKTRRLVQCFVTSKIKFQNMEDSLKSKPDKRSASSFVWYWD